MEFENLLPLFDDLLSAIRSQVEECKRLRQVEPGVTLYTRWKVDTVDETETGPHPSRSHLENIPRQDWLRAILLVSEQLRTGQPYLTFIAAIEQLLGKDVHQEVGQALAVLVGNVFQDQTLDSQEFLDFLFKAIEGRPVSAWSDIDILGITLKTKAIRLHGAKCRILLRQLDIPDFEEESPHYALHMPEDRLSKMPDSILRLETDAVSSSNLQQETKKVLVLLRLFNVCSVDFGRQVHRASSPLRFVGRTTIGGTMYPGLIRAGRHHLSFMNNSQEGLQRFWEFVEPRIPEEIVELGSTRTNHLSIAYERYCDGLFARGPIEQEIAAAIMGLEALYFNRDEMQELAYRLSLRVSKLLSKLDIDPHEIQRQIKVGYRIRSLYVHGSHASSKDLSDVKKTGMSPADFGTRLLDYLRISLLHLICSGQEKSQFLDLVEDSFLSPQKDDALGKALMVERQILRGEGTP